MIDPNRSKEVAGMEDAAVDALLHRAMVARPSPAVSSDLTFRAMKRAAALQAAERRAAALARQRRLRGLASLAATLLMSLAVVACVYWRTRNGPFALLSPDSSATSATSTADGSVASATGETPSASSTTDASRSNAWDFSFVGARLLVGSLVVLVVLGLLRPSDGSFGVATGRALAGPETGLPA